MKRTDVTYGQLDRVLKSLGFSYRLLTDDPPAKLYEHTASGAFVTFPPFPDDDYVWDHHLAFAKLTLDNFGIASPKLFDKELQKAG
jgi:hypothetical protein